VIYIIASRISIDISQFETALSLAAWAGVALGNDESISKQHSGKTRKGNRPRRAILTQLAYSTVHTKGTYLSEAVWKQSPYTRRGYVIYRARLRTDLLDTRSLDMLLEISKRLIY